MKEDIEKKKINKIENENWWFKARKELMLHLINYYIQPTPARTVLDLGTGGSALAALIKKRSIILTLDKNINASRYAKMRNIPFILGDGQIIPIRSGSIDAIFLLDTLEHIPDPTKTVSECMRILKQSGIMIIAVPAFTILWTQEDVLAGHTMRYTKKTLTDILKEFSIIKVFYWNFISFFPLLCIRLFSVFQRKQSYESHHESDFFKTVYGDALFVPPLINAFAYSALCVENWFIKTGVSFPVGTSVFVVCKKL